MALPDSISFDDICDKVALLNWELVDSKSDVIECVTKVSLFSWGEYITIVKSTDNIILINSSPTGSQPFTFKRNKLKFRNLLKTLAK
jgi:hypothetical protein